MIFSRYIFPDHWNKTKEKFREYFEKSITENKITNQSFSFEQYEKRTDDFYQWILNRVDWSFYDIIGFTLNYGQLLPSLAVSKKIKELTPEKTIVFGGSRTVGDLGVNVLRAFDYVDCIVSGDGEDALFRLASNPETNTSIPRLIYRNGKQILWNKSDTFVDLNTLRA